MKSEKITAAILTELRKPLIIDEIELPETLSVGQVLVKIHYSGICGSQIGEIDGAKGQDKYLPHLLGHEGVATVLETGPGVKHVQKGDKVVLHWRKGAGIESDAPVYKWRGERLNAGWVTTFNTHAVISENRMTKIQVDENLKVLPLFGCAVTTGFGVVENNAKLKIGESAVVFGAGGIGLNVIQAASLVSAYPIIAVDIYDNRLELAAKMGATHLINSSKENAEEKIRNIVGNAGADVFIDNTGKPLVIEMGYQLVKPSGRVVLVGVPSNGSSINIFSLPLHFGKQLTGSHGGEAMPAIDIPRYYALYKAGRLQLDQLVSKEYTLAEVNMAIDDMRSGQLSGRCLIKMD